MRLLAHGGTSYTERRRVGAWPAIPRGPLEDTYGLPGESTIYGLGILEDCQPFLVLRRRQITDAGRSYAYTLLLDPGRDVWLTFGWNAAELLRAILSDQIGDELLLRPDSLPTEGLAQRLAQLKPSAPASNAAPMPLSPASRLLNCWIAGAFNDEPVAFPPSAFGFDARPQHAEIARLHTQISQPCFRAGAGWLVGGSREHGQALGARFVLDEGADTDESSLSVLADSGQQIGAAWELLASHPETGSEIGRLEHLSLCEWEGWATVSGGAAHERLLLLARLVGEDAPGDQIFRSVEAKLKGSPFLATAVRQAAHRRALRVAEDGGQLSQTQTALVLRNFYEHELAIADAAIERLHPDTLLNVAVEYESRPWETNQQATRRLLPLPPYVRANVYLRWLGAADYASLPELLQQAYGFVAASINKARLPTFEELFMGAVEQSTKTTSASLHVWDEFPREHPLWPRVSIIMRDEARSRAQRGSHDWQTEYLRYGDDSGGVALATAAEQTGAQLRVNPSGISQLVQTCLAELRRAGSLAQQAESWLDALAVSPLRPAVPIADKIEIAESDLIPRWRPLFALWLSYRNSPNAGDYNAPLPPGFDGTRMRDTLADELQQMLSEYPLRKSIPDLFGIQRVLKYVPENLVSFLQQHGVGRRNPVTLAAWVGGLRNIGEAAMAAKETVRYAVESPNPLPTDWLFHGFDETQLSNLAASLLYKDYAMDDEERRRRCVEVLSTRNTPKRLCETFRRVFKDCLNESHLLENFLRRYSGDVDALERLFACFGKTLSCNVARHMARSDEEAFLKSARDVFADMEAGAHLTPYRRAVLSHLRSDEQLLKKLFRWGLVSVSELDAQLKEMLARFDDSPDAPDNSGGVDPDDETARPEARIQSKNLTLEGWPSTAEIRRPGYGGVSTPRRNNDEYEDTVEVRREDARGDGRRLGDKRDDDDRPAYDKREDNRRVDEERESARAKSGEEHRRRRGRFWSFFKGLIYERTEANTDGRGDDESEAASSSPQYPEDEASGSGETETRAAEDETR
jgi:hypothetical protein